MTIDCQRIQQEVTNRKISRLCHFTQSRKLPHILGELQGVYSIDSLESLRPDIVDKNDPLRLDGQPNHICCSIEFPNSYFFRQAASREKIFKDWVVLIIKSEIIWRAENKYSYRNAASHPTPIGSGYEAFAKIYAHTVTGSAGMTFTRTSIQLPCCPTDVQAEVLVKEVISKQCIFQIAVATEDKANEEKNRLDLLKIDLDHIMFIIAPHMFDGSWVNMVKAGKYPVEKIVDFS